MSKIRRQQLNPVFHLRTKMEDETTLSKALVKQARISGTLNLSGRGLVTGNCLFICFYSYLMGIVIKLIVGVNRES